ncbi:diguanylate cyclase [Alteromonas sp. 345S023]|uniref:diguanylate cyclase n=1 Tax=Alteromonas profundi TaxID=2696062 RepID=A0A7X5RKL4_9ALTE|nr:GGDEF domain-containing protein [Alteromonas profundi]NDV91113.1 diguanylate cyclase [Alteromonas profundi]
MELRLSYTASLTLRFIFLTLFISLVSARAFANQADENEKFRQYSNLLKTVIYEWNLPSGYTNEQISILIDDSQIIDDTSTVATVIKAVMYEMTAADDAEHKLPIAKPEDITEEQWRYLETLNVTRYAAVKAYYLIAKNANQFDVTSERLKRTIPSLHSLKQEVIQSENQQAVALVSMWLAMEYSEINPMKAIVELEYALPHLKPYDQTNSLETALDSTLAHAWLAEAYMHLNSPSRALKHNYDLIGLQKKNGSIEAFNYAGALEALNTLAQYDDALELLKDASSVAKKSNSIKEEFFVLIMRISVYVNRMAPGDKEFIGKLTEDLSKYENIGLPVNLTTTPYVLNLYHTAIEGSDNDFENAIDKYIHVMDARVNNGYYNKPVELSKLQTLRDIYKLRGDFEKAFFYQQKYEQLLVQSRFSLDNAENAVNDSPLERDIIISKLHKLSREKDKQNLLLKAQRFQALAFALFAILLATLLFGFWRAQRKRTLRAERDDLTGAMSRNAMFKAVAKSMASNATSCMVLIDFDYFKQINDRYGHVVGDEVLSTFGRIVRAHIGKNHRFCRYGGEEFLLYLHNTNEHDAYTLLTKIKSSIEAYASWTTTQTRFSASFSAGAVEFKGESNITKIIKVCDHLLYKAKSNGRGKIETITLAKYFSDTP